jgi:hypothetical protein
MKLELSVEERNLLLDALDSHRYWQLSDPTYRRDGYVVGKGSDDPTSIAAIKRVNALFEKLESMP